MHVCIRRQLLVYIDYICNTSKSTDRVEDYWLHSVMFRSVGITAKAGRPGQLKPSQDVGWIGSMQM